MESLVVTRVAALSQKENFKVCLQAHDKFQEALKLICEERESCLKQLRMFSTNLFAVCMECRKKSQEMRLNIGFFLKAKESHTQRGYQQFQGI